MGMFPGEGEDLTQKGLSEFLNKLNYLLCFANTGHLKKVHEFSSQTSCLSETISCYSFKKIPSILLPNCSEMLYSKQKLSLTLHFVNVVH